MGVWVGKWGWERCGWEREIKGDTKDLCKEGGREGGRRTIRGQCIFNDPLAHVIHVFVVDLIGPGGQWRRRSEGGVGG